MKKFIVLFIILTFCSSCNNENQKEVQNNENEHLVVSCNEANEKVSQGALLIDVRSALEYEKGSIDNALNIPVTQIEKDIDKYVKNKDTEIIVFCQSGSRSKEAFNILNELGYKNIYDLGSINNCS